MPVVWFSPAGFSDIETDGELVTDNGDTLDVFRGWYTETITRAQVRRIVGSRSQEGGELLAQEMHEFDELEKGV